MKRLHSCYACNDELQKFAYSVMYLATGLTQYLYFENSDAELIKLLIKPSAKGNQVFAWKLSMSSSGNHVKHFIG